MKRDVIISCAVTGSGDTLGIHPEVCVSGRMVNGEFRGLVIHVLAVNDFTL